MTPYRISPAFLRLPPEDATDEFRRVYALASREWKERHPGTRLECGRCQSALKNEMTP